MEGVEGRGEGEGDTRIEKFYCDRHCQFVSSSLNCPSEELERTASRQKLGVTKTPLLPDQRTGLR